MSKAKRKPRPRRERDPEQIPFGKHLRRLRVARGLSQEQLGERGGLSSDTIRKLEYGRCSASLLTLRCLAKGLGLSVATLLLSFEQRDVDVERRHQ